MLCTLNIFFSNVVTKRLNVSVNCYKRDAITRPVPCFTLLSLKIIFDTRFPFVTMKHARSFFFTDLHSCVEPFLKRKINIHAPPRARYKKKKKKKKERKKKQQTFISSFSSCFSCRVNGFCSYVPVPAVLLLCRFELLRVVLFLFFAVSDTAILWYTETTEHR